MEIAELVLDYIRVLIWPATIFVLLAWKGHVLVDLLARARRVSMGPASIDLAEVEASVEVLQEVVERTEAMADRSADDAGDITALSRAALRTLHAAALASNPAAEVSPLLVQWMSARAAARIRRSPDVDQGPQ